jgi:hypothetical protein
MTLEQILLIKNSLTFLSKERLFAAYEIAKNLRECDKIIEESKLLSQKLFEMHADKDEDGNFIYEENKVKITDEAAIKRYQEEVRKIIETEHNLIFIKIPSAKLSNEKLPAEILIPLLGVIID